MVKVSERTNLEVTVKFPSLQSLRSTGPELDERFVMSSNHAARTLLRQVAEEELEGEVGQESFWLIKPHLYDFAACQQEALPPAPPSAKLAPVADSCLLTTLKCDGAGWGMRRRVRMMV
ncbi:hypothetical protein GQ55_2G478300 [Panicum hallii var. hallii]|uniref:Uncharacterized protein n=1 Tax=Panicum hallii var. hallii TaxID=1504633 RepID=A0A2T7F083_9POAL|nr:hypothetical protein GQ55_2G478300 [Panicum hallii var. hallii]